MLRDRGVPSQAISVEADSGNTFENAKLVSSFLPQGGAPLKIAILTRAHLRLRAGLTFSRRYPQDHILVDPFPCGFQVEHSLALPEKHQHLTEELPRIESYARQGHIDPPVVPDTLLDAWRRLAALEKKASR